MPVEVYSAEISAGTADLFDASEEEAIDILTASLYSDEEPDADQVVALQSLNLSSLLEDALDEQEPDIGKIKKILKALRVADPESAVSVIEAHFLDLLPTAKEMVLVLEEIKKSGKLLDASKLKDLFLKAYPESPARNIAIIRGWLVDAFLRDVFSLEMVDFKVLNNVSTSLDLRQSYILQGKIRSENFFSKQEVPI